MSVKRTVASTRSGSTRRRAAVEELVRLPEDDRVALGICPAELVVQALRPPRDAPRGSSRVTYEASSVAPSGGERASAPDGVAGCRARRRPSTFGGTRPPRAGLALRRMYRTNHPPLLVLGAAGLSRCGALDEVVASPQRSRISRSSFPPVVLVRRPWVVGSPQAAGRRVVEDERGRALGIRRGEQERDPRAFLRCPEDGTLRAGGVHDGADVVHPRLQRRDLPNGSESPCRACRRDQARRAGKPLDVSTRAACPSRRGGRRAFRGRRRCPSGPRRRPDRRSRRRRSVRS